MTRLLFSLIIIFLISCNPQTVSDRTEDDNTAKTESSNTAGSGRRQLRKAGRGPLRENQNRHNRESAEQKGMHRRGNLLQKNDTILVNDPVLFSAIQTGKIHLQEYTNQLKTFGVVKPVPGHYAEVSVPFDGRITKSNVKLGQRVSAGTKLFEMFSPDYLESVRLFLETKREKEIKEMNYIRKKDLFESEIISKKEYEEARLESDLANKEYEKSLELLKIYNQDVDNVDISRPFNVIAPISGEIVKNEITVGQYLRTDSDPVIILANLDKVRIVANVKEKDLEAVGLDDEVEIRTESKPDHPLKGKVVYISNIMNEQTRSLEVYIECNNSDKILKSGMYVTVNFRHHLKDVLIVPSKAVYQDSNRCFLYVRLDESSFARKEVKVVSIGEDQLLVRSGLNDGSIIVVEGGLYLR